MHLFTRTIHMRGPQEATTAHAIALREYVNAKVEPEIALWAVGFGAPVGTLVYTARVDGLAGVQALGEGLAGDAEYAALLAKGADFISGPPVDHLREAISGDLSATAPPVGSYATVTTAVVADGKYADAIGWGLDIGSHAAEVTGMPVTLLVEMFGTFGTLVWTGIASSAAAADDANAKLNVDPGYMTKLGEGGHLFVPASGHRSIAFRIA